MALCTEKIESKSCDHKPKLRKWMKNQMNRYIRRQFCRQAVDVEDRGYKVGRKPTHGWEY